MRKGEPDPPPHESNAWPTGVMRLDCLWTDHLRYDSTAGCPANGGDAVIQGGVRADRFVPALEPVRSCVQIVDPSEGADNQIGVTCPLDGASIRLKLASA